MTCMYVCVCTQYTFFFLFVYHCAREFEFSPLVVFLYTRCIIFFFSPFCLFLTVSLRRSNNVIIIFMKMSCMRDITRTFSYHVDCKNSICRQLYARTHEHMYDILRAFCFLRCALSYLPTRELKFTRIFIFYSLSDHR